MNEEPKLLMKIALTLVFFLIGSQAIIVAFQKHDDLIEPNDPNITKVADNPSSSYGKIKRHPERVSEFRNWLNDTITWKVEQSEDLVHWVEYNLYQVQKDWLGNEEKQTVILDSRRDAYYRISTNFLEEPVSFKDKSKSEPIIKNETSIPTAKNEAILEFEDYTIRYNWDDYINSKEALTSTYQTKEKDFEWSVVVFLKKDEVFKLDPCYGTITDAVVDEFEYDEQEAGVYTPLSLLKMEDSQYYITSASGDTGNDNDGFLRILQVFDNNGTISKGVKDKWEYDTDYGGWASIFHISGSVYAVVYYDSGAGASRIFTTRAWTNNATLSRYEIDTETLGNKHYSYPNLVHVTGDIYAVVYNEYQGGYDDWIETYEITSAGQISAMLDSEEFDTTSSDTCFGISAEMVDDDTIAIVWTEKTGRDDWICTYNISNVGIIDDNPSHIWEFYSSATNTYGYPFINKLADTATGAFFAISYVDSSQDGWTKTLEISDTGDVNYSFTDSYEWGGGNTINYIHPFIIADPSLYDPGVMGVQYQDVSGDGKIDTFNVSSDGILGTEIDTIEYENLDQVQYCGIAHCSGNYWLLIYEGVSSDGYAVTIEIETPSEEEEEEGAWAQDKKGWFTFCNNLNYSRDKAGFFRFENEDENFFGYRIPSVSTTWRVLSERHMNIQLDYTSSIVSSPHKDGYIDYMCAYLKYDTAQEVAKAGVYDSDGVLMGESNEVTITSNTGAWYQFDFTGDKINVFDTESYNLTIFGNAPGAGGIEEDYLFVGYWVNQPAGYKPKGQSTAGGYPNFPDPAGWNYYYAWHAPALIYAHIGDRNFTYEDRGWFTFSNNLNYTQNSRGHFTFSNNLNFTRDSTGFFGFSNNLNFTQDSIGFFKFNNNLNFTREKAGFFKFNNNKNFTQDKLGYFLFSNNLNYTREKAGFFTFSNNLNYTQNNKGFFRFSNNLNFSRDTTGFFTFSHNQNFTRDKLGWFRFFDNLNWTQDTLGFFTFNNNMNFTQDTRGYFLFENNMNFTYNTRGWFTFLNNMNYSQNTRGFFRFWNNMNFTRNTLGWFSFVNSTTKSCFTYTIDGNTVRCDASCSDNATHYRWSYTSSEGTGNTTWSSSYEYIISILAEGDITIILEVRDGAGNISRSTQSFFISDTRDIIPPEECTSWKDCEDNGWYWYDNECHDCEKPEPWDDWNDFINPDNSPVPTHIILGTWKIPLWILVVVSIILIALIGVSYRYRRKINAKLYKLKEVGADEQKRDEPGKES